MRLVNDPESQEFSSWLLDVGHGWSCSDNGTIPLPPNMISSDLDVFIDEIYPVVASNPPPPPGYFLDWIILAPRNSDVDDMNIKLLSMMSGEEQVFYSADSVTQEAGADDKTSDVNMFPIEFLRSLTASGLPPGELRLKLGCPLILLQNLSPSRGLCNGTHLILT
jgi:ATP-dependent DNA helicase PIF1